MLSRSVEPPNAPAAEAFWATDCPQTGVRESHWRCARFGNAVFSEAVTAESKNHGKQQMMWVLLWSTISC